MAWHVQVAYEGTEGLPQTGPLLLMVVDPTPHQIPVAQVNTQTRHA